MQLNSNPIFFFTFRKMSKTAFDTRDAYCNHIPFCASISEQNRASYHRNFAAYRNFV
jgi:hypothetical protein